VKSSVLFISLPLVVGLSLVLGLGGMPAALAAGRLEPVATIKMPGVKGRIDHFAVDVTHRRLFVAALGNDSVEVLDVAHGRREKSVRGFHEPQGIGYLASENRLYVANAGGGVDILDATSLSRLKRIEPLDDADNVRYDARAGTVLVGYGSGVLRVLDAKTAQSQGDIALSGHPESFQLEASGPRIFVNVPSGRHIAVVDRERRSVVATWPVPAKANFPMALDEQGRRLFVGARSPALLLVYDIDKGSVLARAKIGGDTDDLFFDARRKLVYVICGEGRVDVLRREGDRYSLAQSVKTAPRARTGLFVPEDGRLYVAAPATAQSPARVLVYEAKDR
jgi:DNA-binding beta-propeller fold protein YncE